MKLINQSINSNLLRINYPLSISINNLTISDVKENCNPYSSKNINLKYRLLTKSSAICL